MEPAKTSAHMNEAEPIARRWRELVEQRQFQQVIDQAPAALAAHPGHRDLLYFLAVAQRMLQRIPEALATLATLESHHPKYSRLFQERGHCHIFRRDAAEAIQAFERAIQLNAALPATWKSLQTLYRLAGRVQDADSAGQHVAKLVSLPLEITTARSMIADGELREAEDLIRPYLADHPKDVEALRLMASIARQSEVAIDAAMLLEAVLQLAPGYHAARYDYVLALADLHKHAEALAHVEQLIEVDPRNLVNRITRAGVLVSLGRLEEAVANYHEFIKQIPRDPELHQSLGHALKTLGRQAEAIDAYRQAVEIRPGFGEIWWSLANLKTYRFTDSELERMRGEEARQVIQPVDRYHLCFALGKALDDRGEYAESFAYYQRGNALKRTECRYGPGVMERNTRLQQAVCTADFFAARGGYGCDSRAPVFIVGLPRAGSTLIEQILASHSQIEGTMELADVPRLVAQLEGRATPGGESRYPAVLAELTAEDCRQFGERYLAETLPYRRGMPYFIDKMPNNFRHLGLIHLMLPNARIIDARRGAMDCCFSNFKQLFASGQQFTYSLEDIARYYRTYVELMAHWQTVLPGRILRVQHEELVDEFEPQVRRILDFCGLDFEPACLDFHKSARRVHTASSEQVRRPINREGFDQWRRYESWLGALKTALGDLAEENVQARAS